jgi:hypothetical protein
MVFQGDSDGPESEIEAMAAQVRDRIQAMVDDSIKRRGGKVFNGGAD